MLIATFNATTGWHGKKIERIGKRLFIEGIGAIAPLNVFEYEASGQIDWVSEGVRALVGGMANQRQEQADRSEWDQSLNSSHAMRIIIALGLIAVLIGLFINFWG